MHTFQTRVYYEDTDMAGVVYYANYLKFIERGRSEALRDLGIDQSKLREDGLVFVVRKLSADYHAPARFDDELTVLTGTQDVKGASLTMVQQVLRAGEKLFSANVQIACMDLAGRPQRLPTEVRHLLVQVATG